ncbi:cysteine-rich DPF motif domain-containing protein 1 isoform X2 [Gallus gallus]|nr:cysteine-rich DPF motif domain-containing protein 1 isoform X2 [Gallus gallus]
MDSSKEPEPTGEFKCQLCGLTAPYTYYGQKPPNTHSIVILEDSYVMKDPFTPDKEKFLILGSLCSLCRRTVCVGAHASFVAERDLELMQWSGCMDESTQEEMSPDHLNGLQHVFVQPDATALRAAKSWPFFQGGHSLSRSNVLKSGVQLIACI